MEGLEEATPENIVLTIKLHWWVRQDAPINGYRD